MSKTHWSDTVKSSMTEDYAKLLRVARAAKDVADDAYYSEEGGPHYLVDAPFVYDLKEALEGAQHLLEVVK